MKIVIIGCGKAGKTLALSLSKKYNVYIADTDAFELESLRGKPNINLIYKSGADHMVLNEIGMEDTDLFIATSSSDEVNILACKFAKVLGAKCTVARVRQQAYRQADIQFIQDLYDIDMIINPDYNTAKQIYDYLTVPIRVENTSYIDMRKTVPLKLKDVIIVGGGRITYYLAKMLLDIGCHVKIIEQNHKKGQQLCAALPNSAIIIEGDGTQHSLLLEEGLDVSDAFVSLTGIDEENLLASIFAQNCGVKRIVTKINRYSYGDLCEQLNLAKVVSPKDLTASMIFDYADQLNFTISNNGLSGEVDEHMEELTV